jgi:hypothetical protein
MAEVKVMGLLISLICHPDTVAILSTVRLEKTCVLGTERGGISTEPVAMKRRFLQALSNAQ